MRSYPELAKLRVGCVQYLNARPLIAAFESPVAFHHPAALAEMLRSGELDIALVPSFELFARPASYYAVDGVAIASNGPVYSVFLAYHGEIEAVKKVALDPASLSSAHLARCLFEHFNHYNFEYVTEAGEADARVLIGNQAIQFRQSAGPDWRFLDFGEEWKRVTGHPFVYALWLVREDTPGAREAAVELRELSARGKERIEAIVAAGTEFGKDFRRDYLTRHIQFGLGPEEKSGLFEFGRVLQQLKLVETCPIRPIFI